VDEKNNFDKRYRKAQLKGTSDKAPSYFRPDLKRYTSGRYLSIRTLLQVAFNTLPISLIFPVDKN
jgi:hypothetical protein